MRWSGGSDLQDTAPARKGENRGALPQKPQACCIIHVFVWFLDQLRPTDGTLGGQGR